MTMGVVINIHDLGGVHTKLDKILELLQASKRREIAMTQELDVLQAAVEENTSLDNSIIQLVEGLADQLAAVKDDPAKIAALAASLKASSAAVAAAIQAHTTEPPEEGTPEV